MEAVGDFNEPANEADDSDVNEADERGPSEADESDMDGIETVGDFDEPANGDDVHPKNKHGTMERLQSQIDATTPSAKQRAFQQLAETITRIEDGSIHGTRDLSPNPKIFEAFEEAFRVAASRTMQVIHKVRTSYYTKHGGEWTRYSEKQINELYVNRNLYWVETTNKGTEVVYEVKSASFLKAYLKQQEYSSEYVGVICKPPKYITEDDADKLNLWVPFAAEAMPMPTTLSEGAEMLTRILEHLHRMCGKAWDPFEFGVKWHSNMIQMPHKPGGVTLVLIGEMGVGKSMWVDFMSRMLGKHIFHSSSSPENDVWGKFNSVMQGKVLVELAEISQKNTSESNQKIKDITTGNELTIEAKGIAGIRVPNVLHFIVTTNNPTPFDADRRNAQVFASDEYYIDPKHPTKCKCQKCGPSTAFFGELATLFNKPEAIRMGFEFFNRAAVHIYQLTAHDIPQTAARDLSRKAHESFEVRFLKYLIEGYEEDSIEFHDTSTDEEARLQPKAVWTVFRRFKEDNPSCAITSKTSLELKLGGYNLKRPTLLWKGRKHIDDTYPWFYMFNIKGLKRELHPEEQADADEETANDEAADPANGGAQMADHSNDDEGVEYAYKSKYPYINRMVQDFMKILQEEGTWDVPDRALCEEVEEADEDADEEQDEVDESEDNEEGGDAVSPKRARVG